MSKKQPFVRDQRYIHDRITADGNAIDDNQSWPVESGRYRLVAARACPWAGRALITRRLLGLEGAISLGLAGPTHDQSSWKFDLDPGGVDPVLGIEKLQQAYFKRYPEYPLGITVPAMVEESSGMVVTNDFRTLVRDFSTEWTEFHRPGAPDLYPERHRDEIDEMNDIVFKEVNNGVYRAGFAGDQESYEAAHNELFARLDWLSDHLSTRRYLIGDSITESDINLFCTLVRFDAVYHGHFKCNRNKLIELPVLWDYTRDLFQTPGFGDTIDFQQIKEHYYIVHTGINPTQIVPVGPDSSLWSLPHSRDELGGSPFGAGTAPGPVAAGEEVRQYAFSHERGQVGAIQNRTPEV